jgi:hypothetical protein
MFQSKGLPAFLGNRFFLEVQKKRKKVVKRQEVRQIAYYVWTKTLLVMEHLLVAAGNMSYILLDV